jgi:hypothetical protein
MAIPVNLVAEFRFAEYDPNARKKEYIDNVKKKVTSKNIKNWDAVRAKSVVVSTDETPEVRYRGE